MVKLIAKKLAKKLRPETLLRIKEQKLDQKDILHALINDVFGADALSTSVGALERELMALLCPPCEVWSRLFAIKYDALANYVIPGQGQSFDELRTDFMKASVGEIVDSLTLQIMNFSSFSDAAKIDDDAMKAAFDKGCDELYKKIIRKCYGNKRKAFKEKCKAYKAPLADFSSILDSLFEKALETHPFKEIYYSLGELDKIAHQIQKGEYNIIDRCWECFKVVDGSYVCGDCRAAPYCGETCQRKARENGHRFSCKSTKKIYKNFRKNRDMIKAAFADPEKHENLYGYKPNYRIDYMQLWYPVQGFLTDDGYGRFELPSMDHFYLNLSQVKKGLLWSERPLAIPDIESAVPLNINDEADLENLIRNGLALCHQYPDYSPDETIETFNRRNSEFHSNWSTGITMIEPKVASNCTAAEFLKTYMSLEQPQSYVHIFRDTAVSMAFQTMRGHDKIVGSKAYDLEARRRWG